MPLAKKDYKYTYADYLTWEDENWELVDGVPFSMSPAPNREHQKISGEIFRQLANYLNSKSCEVYVAPFDIRFAEINADNKDVVNTVQPDISIICDKSKLDDKGCCGAPDMIIEVVSPSNASRDYIDKLKLYEKYRVKEYWIVDPTDRIIHIYKITEKNEYGRPEIYSHKDNVKVGIFNDLEIDMGMVFS